MNEKEQRSGKCPQCGEMLTVPAELAEFSCLYCGARLRQEMLVTESKREAEDVESARAAFRAEAKRLAGCILDYAGYNRKIVRDQFENAFAVYESGTAPIFRALDEAACPLESERSALLQEAAEEMLNDLETAWKKNPKWRNSMQRNGIRDDDKIILAIFFVPALRKQKLSISEELCARIQKEWVARHPDSPFYLGDYETISGGFRKKILGLCFITTAVCEASGLPDDCAELTAFRSFRDGYLRASEGGDALIEEYYDIAPAIVTCIDVCTDRAAKYADIRKKWLEPCYRDLQTGRMEQCKSRYIEMVRSLEREFFC